MKKKRGVTLVEVIITMAVTSLIISLIYPIFLSGNRNLIKLDMQNDLKMEASNIDNKLNEMLIQAYGIEEVFYIPQTNSDGSYKNLCDSYTKISEDTFNINESDFIILGITVPGEIVDEQVTLNLKYSHEIDGIKIYKLELSKLGGTAILLSDNIKSFSIEDLNLGTLKEAKSIKIKIELYNKKGTTVVEHSISNIVTFRNKQ